MDKRTARLIEDYTGYTAILLPEGMIGAVRGSLSRAALSDVVWAVGPLHGHDWHGPMASVEAAHGPLPRETWQGSYQEHARAERAARAAPLSAELAFGRMVARAERRGAAVPKPNPIGKGIAGKVYRSRMLALYAEWKRSATL